jgi:hypothetical protein
MSEWQPIETAPKGIKIIAGYHNELGNWRTIMARYYPHGTLDVHEDCEDMGDEDGYAVEGWYEEAENQEGLFPPERPLEHWQPLPVPPGQ